MHSRVRALLARAASKSAALSSTLYLRNSRVVAVTDYTAFANGYRLDCEYHSPSSPEADMYVWKWKLSALLLNDKDQEIIYRDKRDECHLELISGLAKHMGLYCQRYGEAIVASKVPLPNYRPDLDDMRPQREVVIPLSVQSRVESLLQEHLDRTSLNSKKGGQISNEMESSNPVENADTAEHADPFLDASVMEKVLQRRSLRLRNMQRTWQESSEGRRMLDFRKSLPAFREKERLLQEIVTNQVVVISGETGCGKTTQLPQYILEANIESGRGAFCNIICTQPRRISAMTVAERVSAERGEPLGESIGYKVRLEGTKGKNTHLLFCTTGILLRRLLSDRNLDGVTHIFVDEIHERGMNEDFLLIVLKDLLPRQRDLRLILMSATLNADLFSNYFGGAPMIHIPGFTYPVRVCFLEDILEMTGYEITLSNQLDDHAQEKLRKTQRQLAPQKRINQITTLAEDAMSKANFENYSSRVQESLWYWIPDFVGFNLLKAVLCHITRKERLGSVLVFMTGWEDISCLKNQLKAHPLLGDPNRVLLLTCHGSMETSEQKLIFERPPPNVRKIVLATNIAEASITINDIVFVVDCGKAKETTYDALNNTPCLLPSWISQASARQRRGRAGRVQPGECYHLYPRCLYDAFAEYQLPELLRTPLNSLCLQIKSLQVESIGDFISASLQPPEPLAVQNAVDYLKMIGALDENEKLTHLGKFLSVLPVDPNLGKMLIMGAIYCCIDPILTIVAGLSARDPFLLPRDKNDSGSAKLRFSAEDYSDHIALVRAYDGWKNAKRKGSARKYCGRNFLSRQTLQAIHSLRKQFTNILKDAGLLDTDAPTNNRLSHNHSLVCGVICSGLFPGIVSVVPQNGTMSFKTMVDGPVFLNANSVNARDDTIQYPWLVFGEKVKVHNVFIRDSTGVSDSILLLFGGKLECGATGGHLQMLEGYIEFFMCPSLAECYLKLKEEADKLLVQKLEHPSMDIHKEGKYLMLAIQELLSGDQCEGRFVFGRYSKKPTESHHKERYTGLLQTLMMGDGPLSPKYKTKHIKTKEYRALAEFKANAVSRETEEKQALSEKDGDVLAWLTRTSENSHVKDFNSPLDVTDIKAHSTLRK